MKTTLNKIRTKKPCAYGWKKLLAHFGKTQADDEALSIITILDSNGLDDALWCLRTVTGHDRELRLYAVWCARQVQHLMTDKRSLEALDVAERFANGLATADDLAAASAAARSAMAAAGSVRGAAMAAAMAATAAAGAVRDAASAAARSAMAAWSAAWDAAWSDAWTDAWDAAWGAARSAARDAQEKRLREVCAAIDAAIAQQNKETV